MVLLGPRMIVYSSWSEILDPCGLKRDQLAVASATNPAIKQRVSVNSEHPAWYQCNSCNAYFSIFQRPLVVPPVPRPLVVPPVPPGSGCCSSLSILPIPLSEFSSVLSTGLKPSAGANMSQRICLCSSLLLLF